MRKLIFALLLLGALTAAIGLSFSAYVYKENEPLWGILRRPNPQVRNFNPKLLPDEIARVAEESVVGVRFVLQDLPFRGSAPSAREYFGTGFVVADKYVLTSLHVVSQEGYAFTVFSRRMLSIEIVDNNFSYPAFIAALDYQNDLAVLLVLDVPGRPFSKRPVGFSRTPIESDSRENFFTFRFEPFGPKSFIKHAGFRKNGRETVYSKNFVQEQFLGALKGEAVNGFSGSPVFDSAGRCRGVLVGSFPIEQSRYFFQHARTGFVPGWVIVQFLKQGAIL